MASVHLFGLSICVCDARRDRHASATTPAKVASSQVHSGNSNCNTLGAKALNYTYHVTSLKLIENVRKENVKNCCIFVSCGLRWIGGIKEIRNLHKRMNEAGYFRDGNIANVIILTAVTHVIEKSNH